VYERFWRRELDIEDKNAIAAILNEVGVNGEGFLTYLDGAGRADLAAIQQRAEADEIFGVPIVIVEGEMFWEGGCIPCSERD
jgi:2-hydroxychromene-2-carboxylate isomerase